MAASRRLQAALREAQGAAALQRRRTAAPRKQSRRGRPGRCGGAPDAGGCNGVRQRRTRLDAVPLDEGKFSGTTEGLLLKCASSALLQH